MIIHIQDIFDNELELVLIHTEPVKNSETNFFTLTRPKLIVWKAEMHFIKYSLYEGRVQPFKSFETNFFYHFLGGGQTGHRIQAAPLAQLLQHHPQLLTTSDIHS